MSLTVTIPRIETSRLILRGHQVDDLPEMVAFFATDRSRYVGGPIDQGDCWRAMLRGAGHWVLRGYGLWHIEEKATGKLAGWTGILNHIEWPEPELAWTLFDKSFEGRGIAFEAASAARSYAARHFGLNRLISPIAPDNAPSIALAKRLGAQFEAEATIKGHDCHIYRHPTEELS